MAPSVSPVSTHYALVVDAGSSGSRLQIYSWRDPDLERAEILQEVQEARRGHMARKWWLGGHFWNGKGKGKGTEVDMERSALRRLVRVGRGVDGEDWVKRVEPGISTIAPDDIPSYLAPLLSHALQQIPPSQHSTTPIYVLATAGMRLLSPDVRNLILKATCDIIRSDYPFSVAGPSSAGPCGENVRVISGEEEGMWGWVAVNYLMDGFGHAPDPSSSTSTAASSSASGLLPLAPLADAPPASTSDSVTPVDVHHHSPTFGFLDMGGASTQLAFSPTGTELALSGIAETDLYNVSLRLLSGELVHWPVFVASWLGFGTNRVRERYIEGLVERWRREADASGVPPDLSTPITDPCLSLGLTIPSPEPPIHPGLLGSGAFSSCLTELRPLLDHSTPCPAQHCLFGGVPTPHIDFQREDQRGFIGISEYWYTAQQVLGLGGVWDWGEWERGMGEFCARDWQAIEAQVEVEKGWRGSKLELSRLEMQCFKGAWISNILHEGIGIPRLVDAGGNDTLTGGDLGDTNAEAERRAREKGLLESKGKHHFQSMDEVGETAISWTLGKMVIEASKAVQPRSNAIEQAWARRLPGLALDRFEHRMNDLGIQTIWAYGFVAFFLLACVFTSLRRRFRFSFMPSPQRGRKPSVSGDAPVPATITRSWPWTAVSHENGYSVEDGIDLISTRPATRATIGRIRLWSIRLGNIVKRNIPFGHHMDSRPRAMRQASMPLTSTSLSSTPFASGYQSQLPSPKQNSFFFTPANGNLSVPSTRPASTTPEPRTNGSASTVAVSPSQTPTLTASPPRLKGSGRPAARPRQNSSNSRLPTLTLPEGKVARGWKDPPMSAFNDAIDDRVPSGMLTPTARSGYEHTLSRNSSRVNLSEIGLAQRSASRAATPYDLEDGTP